MAQDTISFSYRILEKEKLEKLLHCLRIQNSLSVELRAKMAQAIVSSDFRKDVGLLSVGSGSAEPGITIGIHEKFEDKLNAEQFYYEKYKNMIPFDVPIRIEFHPPATFAAGN